MTRPAARPARARLLLAFEACELSDLARALVPIGEDEPLTGGATLADAARVLAGAHRLVAAAVVYERVSGAGWPLVGDVLGLSAGQARERFAGAETRFRDQLRSPSPDPAGAPGGMRWWRAHLVREPREAVADLDDWVLRHDDGDRHGAAPVSGGLERFEGP